MTASHTPACPTPAARILDGRRVAEDLLGVDFDIHGGGNDLTFPHHENEAAQTRMARGAELARIWMHNGMLQLGGEKMAKSVGNIASLAEVLDEWGSEALVLFFATGHYRQPIQFSPDTMAQARARARRIREAGRRLVPGPSPQDLAPHREAFFDALADDFNTAKALAALAEWVAEANKREGVGSDDLAAMLGVLGLASLLEPEAGGEDAPDEHALALLAERDAARARKDFAASDRLRDELAALGWQVRDGADGASLVRP